MLGINSKYPLNPVLDWEIEESPVFDASGNKINGYKMIVNAEDQAVLNICKKTYTPTPNHVFLETVGKLTEVSGFQLEGFHTFKQGQKVLAYLKNPQPKSLAGEKAQDFMVVGNSHDGSTCFFTGLTNQVYRCENMFSAHNMQNRIYHRKNHEAVIDDLVETHDLYFNQLTGCYEMLEDFTRCPVTPEIAQNFVQEVLKIENPEEVSSRKRNTVERFLEALEVETEAVGNNLYGLFNGATRYTTHMMKSKYAIFGNPFGEANRINQAALSFCKAQAEQGPRTKVISIAPPEKPTNQNQFVELF